MECARRLNGCGNVPVMFIGVSLSMLHYISVIYLLCVYIKYNGNKNELQLYAFFKKQEITPKGQRRIVK